MLLKSAHISLTDDYKNYHDQDFDHRKPIFKLSIQSTSDNVSINIIEITLNLHLLHTDQVD